MNHPYRKMALCLSLPFLISQSALAAEASAPEVTSTVAPTQAVVESNSSADSKPAAADYTASAITPIFSQLLYMGYPAGFTTVSENAAPQRYIREAVLNGENLTEWSQMLTVTGVKDTASETGVSPANYAEHIAGGFRRVCAESFSQKKLSEGIVNGYEQYVLVASCGQSPATAGRTSEAALIIVIKGRRDFYTVQWAERSMPSAAPLAINLNKWIERYKQLAPIRLCTRIPGEREPYPSCINGAG